MRYKYRYIEVIINSANLAKLYTKQKKLIQLLGLFFDLYSIFTLHKPWKLIYSYFCLANEHIMNKNFDIKLDHIDFQVFYFSYLIQKDTRLSI